MRNFDVEREVNNVVEFIRDYYKKNNLGGAILGISGGKDSGVVAALLVRALGSKNVIGVTLPCHSKEEDSIDAKLISDYYGFNSNYELKALNEAYTEEVLENGDKRIVLKLKPHLAPVKVAVLPLAKNNEQLMAKAQDIKDRIQMLGLGKVVLETSGNVGKAYRKHDEIGTPICVTVDFETLEKEPETITIRDRDTMSQIRLPVSELLNYISNFFKYV